MKKHLLTCFTVFHSLLIIAQEQTKPAYLTPLHPYDLGIAWGFSSQPAITAPVEDFRKLAPGSQLLNFPQNSYTRSFGGFMEANSMFNASLGLQLRNKRKQEYRSNPQLRAGISYSSLTVITENYNREINKPYDTLTSSQTGQAVYIDSTFSSNYHMSYYVNLLAVDVSVIFRTSNEARWSLFAGGGITAGMALNAVTEVFHNEYKGTVSYSSNGNNANSNSSYYMNNYGSNSKVEYERFENKPGYGFTGYFPMGLDFRIGKKREFWKPLHLYWEFRPAITVTSIPELGSWITPGIQFTEGIRYTFPAAAK